MFNNPKKLSDYCLKTLKGFSDNLCSLRLFLQEKKGQTLIEAIVTIAVAFVIIGSIVALVNASNRRATLARQATQASKLAQEGMEIIRNIRDVKDAKGVQQDSTAMCTTAAPCTWSALYDNLQGNLDVSLLKVGQTKGAADCTGSDSWCLIPRAIGEDLLLDIFTRTVQISDELVEVGVHDYICADPDTVDPLESENIKRVTVTVSWNSPIGAQSRTAVSCISNWR